MNILLSVVLVFSIIGTLGCTALISWDFSDSGDATADMSNVLSSANEDAHYFLVAGTDESESLTDIMMVVCFDTKKNTAEILQIPRDTFIGLDVTTCKMNAVYSNAPREEGQTSINTLLRRINDYYGLPIDHYITVTLSAFRDIVDSVGGVDVYVPSTITNAFNSNDNRYTFYEGMNHMDGEMAEAFVRHRKSYAMGDIGRVEAQRSFYSAFIKKCLNMTYSQITSAATKIYDQVTTDMKLVDILGYAELALKLDTENINFHAVPGQFWNGSPAPGYQSLSYFSIHKEEYVELINTYFMPYSEGIKVEDLLIEELHTSYSSSVTDYDGSVDEYLSDDDA